MPETLPRDVNSRQRGSYKLDPDHNIAQRNIPAGGVGHVVGDASEATDIGTSLYVLDPNGKYVALSARANGALLTEEQSNYNAEIIEHLRVIISHLSMLTESHTDLGEF